MKRKKGIFFTIVAIMIITILTIGFISYEHVTSKDRIPVVTSRVGAANSYVRSVGNSYLPSALEISSRDAMNSLVLYINKTTYLPNFREVNRTFIELMLNGSINGTPVECYLDDKPLVTSQCLATLDPKYVVMSNRTFFYRLSTLENASRDMLYIKTGFKKSPSEYATAVYQSNSTGPWRVGVNLTINYTVDASIAYWNISQLVAITFPIEGLLDPVYLVNASHFNSTIIRTNSTVWNISNLSKLIEDGRYRFEPTAPSFLMRLYYNMSNGGPSAASGYTLSGSGCCGIESPINPNRMNADPLTAKSYIDWCFYSSMCAPENNNQSATLWNITGVTTYVAGQKYIGFKMDIYHAVSTYNLSVGLLS